MIPIYVQCGLLSSYDRLEDEIHLSGYSEEEKSIYGRTVNSAYYLMELMKLLTLKWANC